MNFNKKTIKDAVKLVDYLYELNYFYFFHFEHIFHKLIEESINSNLN